MNRNIIAVCLLTISLKTSAQTVLLGHHKAEVAKVLSKKNISEYKSKDGKDVISFEEGAILSMYRFDGAGTCINCTFLLRDQNLIKYQLTKLRVDAKPYKYSPDDCWQMTFEGIPTIVAMTPLPSGQNKMFTYAYDSMTIYELKLKARNKK